MSSATLYCYYIAGNAETIRSIMCDTRDSPNEKLKFINKNVQLTF